MLDPMMMRMGVPRRGSISLKSTATGRAVLTRATAGGGAAPGEMAVDLRSEAEPLNAEFNAGSPLGGSGVGAGGDAYGELDSGITGGGSTSGIGAGFGIANGTLAGTGTGTRGLDNGPGEALMFEPSLGGSGAGGGGSGRG